MISVFIQGGLGNQMFQIATAVSLAKDMNTDLVIEDGQHHLPLQGNNISNYRSNVFKDIKFSKLDNNFLLYKEPSFSYKKIPHIDRLFLYGYFQTEKYFVDNKEYIKSLFIDPASINIVKKIYPFLGKENVVSLHVRRGDYLKNPKMHPTQSVGYYLDALDMIKKYDRILVFSDDPEWCRMNFNNSKMEFSKTKDYLEMYAMSLCNHNILANSSFSWWGAWLNQNNGTVVAPSTWFGPDGPQDYKDIYCKDWNII